eukprot:SAG22_NODE_15707_length_342_cov_1.539095_1_plen_27_part_10
MPASHACAAESQVAGSWRLCSGNIGGR